MKIQRLYVGLDYHKASIQVCVLDHQGNVLGNRRFANDWIPIVQWTRTLGHVERCAIESCGGAADLAEQLVTLAGWSVDLAHPGYVARLKGSPDKSDFSDARLLADLTRVGYLPKVWLAPEGIRELRRLVRYRQQLAEQRRSIKLRIRALLRDHRVTELTGKPWTKRWLAWLDECDDRAAHGAAGDRTNHCVDDPRGDRALRSLHQREAVGQVLRPLAAQRLQRRTSGGCGVDQSGQCAPSRRADRGGMAVGEM